MTKNEQIASLVAAYYRKSILDSHGDTFDGVYDYCVNLVDVLQWAVETVETNKYEEEMESLKD